MLQSIVSRRNDPATAALGAVALGALAAGALALGFVAVNWLVVRRARFGRLLVRKTDDVEPDWGF